MTDYLTVAEVIAMHADQIERYGGSHGMRDQGLLEAALYRPQTGYYADLIEEAAAPVGKPRAKPSLHRRQQADGLRRHLHLSRHQRRAHRGRCQSGVCFHRRALRDQRFHL